MELIPLKYLNNELSESTNTNTYLNHNPGKKYKIL